MKNRRRESWQYLTFRPIRNEKEDRRLARLGIQIDPGKYKIDPLRQNPVFIWVTSDILK